MVSESRNNGIPLITAFPKSKITRSIQQLAAQMDTGSVTESAEEDSSEKPKRRLFSFLGQGAKSS
jgi:pilus assembly protein CpaE